MSDSGEGDAAAPAANGEKTASASTVLVVEPRRELPRLKIEVAIQ